MPLVLLRLNEVLQRVKLGKSTVYKMIARGEFPAPKQLTANRSVWLESEIEQWLEFRLARGGVHGSSGIGEQGMTKA
jgi:prophage regulatory protein